MLTAHVHAHANQNLQVLILFYIWLLVQVQVHSRMLRVHDQAAPPRMPSPTPPQPRGAPPTNRTATSYPPAPSVHNFSMSDEDFVVYCIMLERAQAECKEAKRQLEWWGYSTIEGNGGPACNKANTYPTQLRDRTLMFGMPDPAYDCSVNGGRTQVILFCIFAPFGVIVFINVLRSCAGASDSKDEGSSERQRTSSQPLSETIGPHLAIILLLVDIGGESSSACM